MSERCRCRRGRKSVTDVREFRVRDADEEEEVLKKDEGAEGPKRRGEQRDWVHAVAVTV